MLSARTIHGSIFIGRVLAVMTFAPPTFTVIKQTWELQWFVGRRIRGQATRCVVRAVLRVGNNWLGGGAMTFCGVQNSGDVRGSRGAKHVAVVYSANFGKLHDSRF